MTYKVRLTARIPKRPNDALTRGQEDEIKQRLEDTAIQDYLIDTVGWNYVDREVETVIEFYEV